MLRPAFIEEFERLEEELKNLYQEYVVLFRCVTYLEQQHESAEQAEQERMEERQVRRRYRKIFRSRIRLGHGIKKNVFDAGCYEKAAGTV